MRPTVILATLLVSALLPCAEAQIFFTGGLQYAADSSGGNAGGAWEYDTFSNPDTSNAKFTVNGSTDIAFSLSLGANAFALGSGGSSGSGYQGLGLFFSSTETPFSGPTGAAPNLAVVDGITAGTTFSFVTAGALVSTYGQFSSEISYSGATSYQIGGYQVAVTAFDFGASGNNLTLTVTAIPEPSVTVAAMAGVTFAAVLFRRGRGFFAGAHKENAVA